MERANRMTTVDTFGAYVRARLDSWGREFALHRDCEYLGHKSKDMLQLLIEHKGEMPQRVTGFKPIEIPIAEQQMEDIVADIARHDVVTASVLRGYYCGQGRRGDERREIAKELIRHVTGDGSVRLDRKRYFTLHHIGFAEVRGRLIGLARAA
jgi:hypothetical protein